VDTAFTEMPGERMCALHPETRRRTRADDRDRRSFAQRASHVDGMAPGERFEALRE